MHDTPGRWNDLAIDGHAAGEAAAQAVQKETRLMHEGDGALLAEGLWALRRELVILLHAPAPDGWIAMAEQERQALTTKLARIDSLLTRMGETTSEAIVQEINAREAASLDALRREAEGDDA